MRPGPAMGGTQEVVRRTGSNRSALPSSFGHACEVTDAPWYAPLEALIDTWCDRRDRQPLAVVLPSYLAVNGLTDSLADLMEALRGLRARRCLPDDEQAEIERLVAVLDRMRYRK